MKTKNVSKLSFSIVVKLGMNRTWLCLQAVSFDFTCFLSVTGVVS